MSTTNRDGAPLYQVRNHHSAGSGTPPHIDGVRPISSWAILKTSLESKAVFVYDRDSSQAVLYLGDAGRETPHAVVAGTVPNLVLSATERQWVRACWQAAKANLKEA
jgi:hypothetical protein